MKKFEKEILENNKEIKKQEKIINKAKKLKGSTATSFWPTTSCEDNSEEALFTDKLNKFLDICRLHYIAAYFAGKQYISKKSFIKSIPQGKICEESFALQYPEAYALSEEYRQIPEDGAVASSKKKIKKKK